MSQSGTRVDAGDQSQPEAGSALPSGADQSRGILGANQDFRDFEQVTKVRQPLHAAKV
jgi:hypothetical protein